MQSAIVILPSFITYAFIVAHFLRFWIIYLQQMCVFRFTPSQSTTTVKHLWKNILIQGIWCDIIFPLDEKKRVRKSKLWCNLQIKIIPYLKIRQERMLICLFWDLVLLKDIFQRLLLLVLIGTSLKFDTSNLGGWILY